MLRKILSIFLVKTKLTKNSINSVILFIMEFSVKMNLRHMYEGNTSS